MKAISSCPLTRCGDKGGVAGSFLKLIRLATFIMELKSGDRVKILGGQNIHPVWKDQFAVFSHYLNKDRALIMVGPLKFDVGINQIQKVGEKPLEYD